MISVRLIWPRERKKPHPHRRYRTGNYSQLKGRVFPYIDLSAVTHIEMLYYAVCTFRPAFWNVLVHRMHPFHIRGQEDPTRVHARPTPVFRLDVKLPEKNLGVGIDIRISYVNM